MKIFASIVAGFFLIIVFVALLFVGYYNSLGAANVATSRSWADLEASYQRRADLIPNLVNVVKGASAFEKSTLEAVVQARASATQVKVDPSAMTPESLAAFSSAQQSVGSALSRLLVTVEKYPELKSTQAYQDLMTQLEGTENRINFSRTTYNEKVGKFNTMLEQMPTSIVAGFRGYTAKPYYKSDEGAAVAPKINL